ncbi:MAG: Lrp/AsnC ligand binding domain-containing protein [Candidatus Thorarchaeota archaeon]|jgi:DNA-binding Lrp family transcriptional regulator|nr:Lrp/AsnC ligand binding domain-containing protein [Candidatus Thorarchaeota archaeon]
MVSVYVLIRADGDKVWETVTGVKEIDGVTRAEVVTGPYDVIMMAELPSVEGLRRLMKSVHDVDGVERTETCIGI